VKGDYQPVLSDEVQGILGIEKTDDVALLSIVTIRSEPLEVSVNLRAPIVINVRNMTALQTVLEDEAYPVRYLIETVQERPAEIPQAVSLKISPTSSDNFA
jgi:flagellar assembly factor FliW